MRLYHNLILLLPLLDSHRFHLIDLSLTIIISVLTTWLYSTHLLLQIFLLQYTFDSRYALLNCIEVSSAIDL